MRVYIAILCTVNMNNILLRLLGILNTIGLIDGQTTQRESKVSQHVVKLGGRVFILNQLQPFNNIKSVTAILERFSLI